MLKELSMASTVTSPAALERQDLLRWMKGLAKASASSRISSRAQREQQQIAQAAVLDRALRALLEEHQRAERLRRGLVLRSRWSQTGRPTAAAPARNQGARNPTYILPCRIARYSRRPSSSGRPVFIRK